MKTPALIICLAFIGLLLWRDAKRRKSLSAAVWLPTIFLLVTGSRPLSYWFGGGGTWNGQGSINDVAGSPIDQIFYFGMLGGAFLLATMRKVQWGRFFAINAPLMLFYGYFALSVFWSEDPMGSVKRLFKDFGMLFVIALILSEKDPIEAVRAVFVRCACVLFPLSAVAIKWYPLVARQFSINGSIMYTGVTTQKNTMGEIAIVFSLFLVWDYLEEKPGKGWWKHLPWDRVLVLMMGLWCLQMCQSKTGLLCLLIGTALLIRKGWFASKMASRVVLYGAMCVPYIVFFAQQYLSLIAPIVSAVGRNLTFTGRSDIWQHIDSSTVNPLIGFGFYNFWGGSGGARVNQAMGMTIPNAHDGYVDLYLDGGIIGLCLLVLVLVVYGNRLVKSLRNDKFQRLRFSILVVAIIYNISESNWARLSTIWFTTVLACSYIPNIKPVARKAANAMRTAKRKMGRAIAEPADAGVGVVEHPSLIQ